tara:strand:- start:2674 stop:2880 length:207 start_codon:yes stop_codon:yes gene_type:complete
MITLSKNPANMTKGELISENYDLFDEKEFWKTTAIEKGVPENSYETLCKEVEQTLRQMDPDNTGFIHG